MARSSEPLKAVGSGKTAGHQVFVNWITLCRSETQGHDQGIYSSSYYRDRRIADRWEHNHPLPRNLRSYKWHTRHHSQDFQQQRLVL